MIIGHTPSVGETIRFKNESNENVKFIITSVNVLTETKANGGNSDIVIRGVPFDAVLIHQVYKEGKILKSTLGMLTYEPLFIFTNVRTEDTESPFILLDEPLFEMTEIVSIRFTQKQQTNHTEREGKLNEIIKNDTIKVWSDISDENR